MTRSTLYVLDAAGVYQPADTPIIVAEAKRRLAARFRRGAALSSPAAAKEAIQLKLSEREHEVFGCLYLDKCAVHRYVQRHRRRQKCLWSASLFTQH